MILVTLVLEGVTFSREDWLPAIPRVGEELWYFDIETEYEVLTLGVWYVESVRWHPGTDDGDYVEVIGVRKRPETVIGVNPEIA